MKNVNEGTNVEGRIYRIWGQQVMLDTDLADLYSVGTKQLNQAVKRNRERFPEDFMFELSRQEILRMSHIVTSSGSPKHLKFSKRITVFTEHGIAMLSGILRSGRAIRVNIANMRTFIKLRHALSVHQGVARKVEMLEGKVNMHETDIRLLIEDVHQLKGRLRPIGPIPPAII